MTRKPLVAIIGRANVGKSTLFNRFLKQRRAIVGDTPGITRDRVYAETDWNGRDFTVVDTGGLYTPAGETLEEEVRRQAEIAIAEADLILFVVDARIGPLPGDEEITHLLRHSGKPVILVANKAEGKRLREDVSEFYRLGLGDPVAISAEQGLNVGDLLDEVVALLPPAPRQEDEKEDEGEKNVRVAVVGRPNVGKSTLLNALLGEERLITSDRPGTTRDAVDVLWSGETGSFLFIDTAGMRRKGRIKSRLERSSVMRAWRAVQQADVALLVLEALSGVTDQDRKIGGYIHEAGKGCVIVVNKWDLMENQEEGHYREMIRYHLAFLEYAPVLMVSAISGKGLDRLLPAVRRVAEAHRCRLPTAGLNQVVRRAVEVNPPPAQRGRSPRIYYVSQPQGRPPTFVFFASDPEAITDGYRRYLERRLREAYNLEGTPVRLIFRARQAGIPR